MEGYYDPPIGAECQHLYKSCCKPYSTKGLQGSTKRQQSVNILATNYVFLWFCKFLFDLRHILSYNAYIINKEVVCLANRQKKRITITVTPEMDQKLRQEAKDRGLSISTVVTLALEEYWKSGK